MKTTMSGCLKILGRQLEVLSAFEEVVKHLQSLTGEQGVDFADCDYDGRRVRMDDFHADTGGPLDGSCFSMEIGYRMRVGSEIIVSVLSNRRQVMAFRYEVANLIRPKHIEVGFSEPDATANKRLKALFAQYAGSTAQNSAPLPVNELISGIVQWIRDMRSAEREAVFADTVELRAVGE